MAKKTQIEYIQCEKCLAKEELEFFNGRLDTVRVIQVNEKICRSLGNWFQIKGKKLKVLHLPCYKEGDEYNG